MDFCVCRVIAFLITVTVASAQFLSLRACTANSTVVASRFANALDANAIAACSTFCGNASNAGTYLYTYFCIAPLGDGFCTYANGYPFISPYNTLQTQVPTLTASTSFLNVPCGFANSPILNNLVASSLGISNPGSQNFVVNQQILSSNPSDSTVGYVYVDPVNGTIYRGSVGPAVDTTQTIAFTLSQTGTAVYSNTVIITFQFQSCALQISGPSRVNVYACCPYDQFSALQFTVTNPNTPVLWDQPGNLGLTNPPLDVFQGVTTPGTGLPAPDILVNNVPLGLDNNPKPGFGTAIIDDPTNDLFIVNINQFRGDGFTNSQVGIYGSNTFQFQYFMLGCQTLVFSATPVFGGGPLTVGSKVVEVCGIGNSEDGRLCGTPQTFVDSFPPGGVTTRTNFPYDGLVNPPPGATGGTISPGYEPLTAGGPAQC